MIRSALRLFGLATVVAAGAVSFAATSQAAPFDGYWSVLIVTSRGACDASFRTAVSISNGIVSGGGGANISGRVSNNGAVSVRVSAGDQSASGSGRLRGNTGGGSWSGRGSRGGCSGSWSASRGG
jgi:hypothetical protein